MLNWQAVWMRMQTQTLRRWWWPQFLSVFISWSLRIRVLLRNCLCMLKRSGCDVLLGAGKSASLIRIQRKARPLNNSKMWHVMNLNLSSWCSSDSSNSFIEQMDCRCVHVSLGDQVSDLRRSFVGWLKKAELETKQHRSDIRQWHWAMEHQTACHHMNCGE